MSKDTAQQEVEKVCFAYEKAGKTGNKKDWGKFYDLEDSLINKVEVANQTKLSIPKKIAEELLDEKGVNYTSYELMVYDDGDWSEDLQEWMEDTDKWWYIVDAYLAGKALGVELVEVSDD
ncbi:hypothetical protein I6H59_02240 [Lactococcus garvieae]|nr:hypothetical protein I6H59_02240 [Lactococcus garvieae]CEF50673.1 hypothetical protein LGMT14_00523 [Lactococcus garvieae]